MIHFILDMQYNLCVCVCFLSLACSTQNVLLYGPYFYINALTRRYKNCMLCSLFSLLLLVVSLVFFLSCLSYDLQKKGIENDLSNLRLLWIKFYDTIYIHTIHINLNCITEIVSFVFFSFVVVFISKLNQQCLFFLLH